uniref:Uncharacterized protein LOC117354536 n=1 Tax=Geotrypetes seraphini TaxID=260995 RepID=A0A6P8PHD9_GEOSA|nr:uncharacterized protein LOC117354536 [Geotrypetes seraphini]XP_033788132.1 uncharacterized protein LOC117354536 [Geotrypetes seraphini]
MDSSVPLASGLCQICAELAPEERPCSKCRVALDGEEEGSMQLAPSDNSRASESQGAPSLEPSESDSAKRQCAELAESMGGQGEMKGVNPFLLGFPPEFIQLMVEAFKAFQGSSGSALVSQGVSLPSHTVHSARVAQSFDTKVQLEGDQDDRGSDSMPLPTRKDSSLLKDAGSQPKCPDRKSLMLLDQGDDQMVSRLFKPAALLEVITESLRILHLDSPQTTAVKRTVMSSAKPQSACFPSHPDITKMLTEQWVVPDSPLRETRIMNKLYPLAQEFQALLASPKLDSLLVHITSRTSPSSEKGVAFKIHAHDRRVDSVLKKQFRALTSGLNAAAATSFVARACHTLLRQTSTAEKDVYPQFLLSGVDYVADALYDMFRVMSKGSACSISARRILWMRHWDGDSSSKATLSRLPFKDQLLFGKGLNDLVASSRKRKAPAFRQRFRRARNSRGSAWNPAGASKKSQ